MAEIRVERKSGLPWWAYLLIALALLGLVIFGVRGCGATTTGALGKPADRALVTGQGDGSCPAEQDLAVLPRTSGPSDV